MGNDFETKFATLRTQVKLVVINVLENQPAAIDLVRSEISLLISEVEAVVKSMRRGRAKVSFPVGQALREPTVVGKDLGYRVTWKKFLTVQPLCQLLERQIFCNLLRPVQLKTRP